MKFAAKLLTASVVLACAGMAHAQKGETVKIAFIDPLSGPFANVGQNQLKSWQFVAERFSGAKNPAGVKFEDNHTEFVNLPSMAEGYIPG